jgi:hypothetical protein
MLGDIRNPGKIESVSFICPAHAGHLVGKQQRSAMKIACKKIDRRSRAAGCNQPPTISLRHSEALAVLAGLGFQGVATKGTFREYIKSLRKLGTPFPGGKIGYGRRVLASYSYEQMMELALILSLRVYHVVPDSILAKIIQHRNKLARLYRWAYVERATGLGRTIIFTYDGNRSFEIGGTFLDLRLNFCGGTLTRFGPLRLLGPAEAIQIFAARDTAARSLLPIHLSDLAERLIDAAAKVAQTRRSPAVRRTHRRHDVKAAVGS